MRLLPIVALSLPLTAYAGKAVEGHVAVVDGEGNPVPNAVIVFDDEGERHIVHGERGDWRGDSLYLPDSTHVPFNKGDVLHFAVAAPGYAATRSALQIDSKKPSVTVALKPLDTPVLACVPEGVERTSDEALAWSREQLDLPPQQVADLGCVYAVQAFASQDAWVRAAAAKLAGPSQDSHAAEWTARENAHAAAKQWMAWATDSGGDADYAELLCQATADRLAPCD